jgi:hypothetical protein
MKTMHLILGLLAAGLLFLVFGTTALAFHDGGVAHCDGCHTMHNSEDGQSIIEGGVVGTTGAHLTKGADPGSTCLSCHEGSGTFHIFSTNGNNFTPGGDFYWLTKTFAWQDLGNTITRNGYNFGHNVIAADFGLVQDPVLSVAPGGTFQSAWLSCSSCHDPHGKKINKSGPIVASGSYRENWNNFAGQELGNFRLLGDQGYPAGPGFTFINRPPIATTPSPFGAGRNETDSSHTDYGQSMSEWCGNCHTGFVAGAGEHRHAASNQATMGPIGIDSNYNIYVKTGDLTGTRATAFLALVPFERGTSQPTNTNPRSTQGPDPASNVMCLSCHRAHASAFPEAGRWDFEADLIADSHPQDSDAGATGGDQIRSYYGRDMVSIFGEGQRSLCNKCHIQD